ncbi:MAG: hypothetical protein EA001_07400 [Oscillatoriales cyanobacterium]|nr:MAG: hypothetical protein EA001_07400 [Oscillatoriales cyanobacterium]
MVSTTPAPMINTNKGLQTITIQIAAIQIAAIQIAAIQIAAIQTVAIQIVNILQWPQATFRYPISK